MSSKYKTEELINELDRVLDDQIAALKVGDIDETAKRQVEFQTLLEQLNWNTQEVASYRQDLERVQLRHKEFTDLCTGLQEELAAKVSEAKKGLAAIKSYIDISK